MLPVGELTANYITFYFGQLQILLESLGFKFNGDAELEIYPEQIVPLWSGFAEKYKSEVTLDVDTFILYSDRSCTVGLPQVSLSNFRFASYPQIGVDTTFTNSQGNQQTLSLLTSEGRNTGGTITSHRSYGGPEVFWSVDLPVFSTVESETSNYIDYGDYCSYFYNTENNNFYIYRKEPFTYNKERDFFQDVVCTEPSLDLPPSYVVPSVPPDPHDLNTVPNLNIPTFPKLDIDYNALESSTSDAGGIVQWLLDAYTEVGISAGLLFAVAVCIVVNALRR